MRPSRLAPPLSPRPSLPLRAGDAPLRAGGLAEGWRARRALTGPVRSPWSPYRALVWFAWSLACVRIFSKKSELSKCYEVGEALGSGNFATVHKAKAKEGRMWKKPDNSEEKVPEAVAVKIIDKSKVEDMNDINREIEIMQMVSHPNVIQLYEIFDETKKMNLVMEVTRTTAAAHATAAHVSLRHAACRMPAAGDGRRAFRPDC